MAVFEEIICITLELLRLNGLLGKSNKQQQAAQAKAASPLVLVPEALAVLVVEAALFYLMVSSIYLMASSHLKEPAVAVRVLKLILGSKSGSAM